MAKMATATGWNTARCASRGQPRTPHQTVTMMPLRVGRVAAQDGWCADYSRTTFHEWFIGRRAPGVADHVERVLAALGRPPAPIIARATSAEGASLLKAATDEARKLGIFGAPTFAIGRDIFWGDDRLEEALGFASGR
jgi:2-hydroxychromene-2-carboxylate isomerase